MKIAVISSNVFAVGGSQGLAGYGGLESIAFHCAKGLAAKGHKVILFAPEGSTCPGATVLPIGPPGQWDEARGYNSYWQELLQFNDGGCIIDHSWNKNSYLLKMEGRLKAPVLAVMHAPVSTMISSMPPLEKPCFVCISKDQASHFEALFSRPARVCYNGIDLDYYKPLKVNRTNRFLFLARFSTVKGPQLAIEACKKAEASLDLVGDTSITNEPEYLEQCKRLCDKKHIVMRGPAGRGECVWFYSQAYGMLHPNRDFREPYGLAPMESQACGCPVIAWKKGAMTETIRHGETGYLVDSLEGLVISIKELQNKTEYGMKVMRENCRDWADEFSLQKMIDRYESLCIEAVEGGGW